MKLITIKESHYSNDLSILKSKLESEGIYCNLKDEYTSQVLSHIPSMSVKLQVYDTDLEKVKSIMIELGESITLVKEIRCPKCGSKNIEANISGLDKFKLFLSYAKSQLFFSKNNSAKGSLSYICSDCGNIFSLINS